MISLYKEKFKKARIYIDTIRGSYGGYVLNQSIKLLFRKFNNNDIELMTVFSKPLTSFILYNH